MHYDFIEIGTCDWNTCIGGSIYGDSIPECPDTAVGLSIDPIYEYLLNLPNKPYVTKIAAAISHYDGTAIVHYVPEEKRIQFDLDWEIKGSSKIDLCPEYAHIMARQKNLNLEDFVVKRTVPRISVNTLISTYSIDSCDFLKIDTEGHDADIITAFVRAWASGMMERPKKIEFECHPLVVDRRVVDMTIELLERFGFKLLERGLVEVQMLRKDQWPADTMHCV